MKRASMKRTSTRRKGSAMNHDELKKLKDMAEKSEKAEARRTSFPNLKIASMDTVKEEGDVQGAETNAKKITNPVESSNTPVPVAATKTVSRLSPIPPVKQNPAPSVPVVATETVSPILSIKQNPVPSVPVVATETVSPIPPVKQNPTPSFEPITPTDSHTPSIEVATPIEAPVTEPESHTLNTSGPSVVSIPDPIANLPKSKSSSSFLKSTPSTDKNPEVHQATPTINSQQMKSREDDTVPLNSQSKSSITISVTEVDVIVEPQVATPSINNDSKTVQTNSNNDIHDQTTHPQLPTITNGTASPTIDIIPEAHAPNTASQTININTLSEEEANSLHPDIIRSSSTSPSFGRSNKGKKSDMLNTSSCTTCGDDSDNENNSLGVDHIRKILNQYRPASGVKIMANIALLATPRVALEFKESKISKRKEKRSFRRRKPGSPDVELISVKARSLTPL